MCFCADGPDVAAGSQRSDGSGLLVLPGLSFDERPRLFAALVAATQDADRTVDVVIGRRPAVVLLHPDDVRAALGSSAKKGRPAGTVQGIQGHIVAEGTEFRRRRGAVMAALRAASSIALPDVPTSDDAGEVMPDTATLLLAHLSGASVCMPLVDLGRRVREIVHTDIAAGGVHESMTSIYAEVEAILVSSVPFVRELLDRGWTTWEVAAEVVTLTFAGWASLAAVCRSARTLGVGGRGVTESDVDELLRIAPPGWLITRETVEPIDLPTRSTEIGPGTLLVMSPWLLHRDPTTWTRPTEFDATRRGTREKRSYMPFGAGTRGCPAERYSRTFLRSLLASQQATTPSAHPMPSLTGDRSTCLVSQEDHPA